jgi:hypothetical protein
MDAIVPAPVSLADNPASHPSPEETLKAEFAKAGKATGYSFAQICIEWIRFGAWIAPGGFIGLCSLVLGIIFARSDDASLALFVVSVGSLVSLGWVLMVAYCKTPSVGLIAEGRRLACLDRLARIAPSFVALDAEYAVQAAMSLYNAAITANPRVPLEKAAWTWGYWALCRLRMQPSVLPKDRLTSSEQELLPGLVRDLVCLDACRTISGDGDVEIRRLVDLEDAVCDRTFKASEDPRLYAALAIALQSKAVTWDILDVQAFVTGCGPLLPGEGRRQLARKILAAWAAADVVSPVKPS